jgi:hypothetical protein
MNGRLGSVLFTVAGAILLAIAIYNAWNTFGFLRSAVRANGTVAALNAGGSHPQIAFQTATGEAISYPQGGLIFGMTPGDAVTVLYLADNPKLTATIDAVGALWFSTILTGGLGAVFLLAGTLWGRKALGG